MDLNIEKTGKISSREFKFYMNFWGMDLSENEFEHVFKRFDLDGDGLFLTRTFNFQLEVRCSHKRVYTSDKTSPSNVKSQAAITRCAGNQLRITRISVFCIRKCIRIKQLRSTPNCSERLAKIGKSSSRQ